MAVAAVVGWFGFMFFAMILLAATDLLARGLWATGYVLSQHTGIELLIDVLRVRFDWAPIPAPILVALHMAVVMSGAPYQAGRLVGAEWRERAVAFTVMLAIVWSALAVAVPFVWTTDVRVTFAMLPVIDLFILAGVVRERRTQLLAEDGGRPA